MSKEKTGGCMFSYIGNKIIGESKHIEYMQVYQGEWFTDPDFEKAVQAGYAYEKNCQLKYEFTSGRPSRHIPKGERLEDYAMMYGVSVKAVKDALREVERRYPEIR